MGGLESCVIASCAYSSLLGNTCELSRARINHRHHLVQTIGNQEQVTYLPDVTVGVESQAVFSHLGLSQ